MATFVKRIASKLALLSCWLIILSAVLLSIARLLTPLLDNHREQLAQIAGKVLECPVQIGNLAASWYHFEPVLKFQNVTAFDPANNKPILKVAEFTVGIDVLKSLWHRRLEPDLLIFAGSQLAIEQTVSGQITVNGAKTGEATNSASTSLDNVIAWLFNHGQIILKDIKVSLFLHNQPHRKFDIYNAYLVNKGKHHYLYGKISLGQEIAQKQQETNKSGNNYLAFSDNIRTLLEKIKIKNIPIYFATDMVTGRQVSELQAARIYLSIRRLSLAELMAGFSWHGLSIGRGIIGAQVWLDWNKSGWQQLQTRLSLQNVVINSKQKKWVKLPLLSGNFMLQRREQGGWELSGDKLNLTINNHPWPENQLHLATVIQNGQQQLQQLQLSYIRLQDLDFLLQQPHLLPEKWQDALQNLQPGGDLREIFWQQEPQGMSAAGQFQNLAFRHWQEIPGINGISGTLQLSPTMGRVEINGANTQLDFAKLFPGPLQLTQWHSSLYLQKLPTGWWITAPHFTGVNEDLALQASLGLLLPANGDSPKVQLLAALSAADAVHSDRYYPEGIMHKNLVGWLKSAVKQAKDVTGTLALRGSLHDFPYKDYSGVFNIQGFINNATLAYHPEWPPLEHLAADLNFTGKSMVINASTGSVLGAQIQQAQATIADFAAQPAIILGITGQVKGDANQGMAFIQQSALSSTLGKQLEPFQLAGPMAAQLKLEIPLDDVSHRLEDKVTGQIDLTDASLGLSAWRLQLNRLTGQFSFSEQGLMDGQLAGELMSQPVQIAISHSAGKRKQAMTTNIKMQGELSAQSLMDYLNWPTSTDTSLNKLTGTTHYQVNVSLQKDPDKQLQQLLKLSSNLKGLSIPFPEPLAKTAEQLKPLTISFLINDHKPSLLAWDYNKVLTGQIELQKKTQHWQVIKGLVSVGNKAKQLLNNRQGLYVTGWLQQFDWQQWKPWLEAWREWNKQSTEQSVIQSIRLQIGKLMALQQKFTNATLKLTPEGDHWILGLNSTQAKGHLLLSTSEAVNAVQASFSKLYLQPQDLKTTIAIQARELPAVNFSCEDFRYGQKRLGNVRLKTAATSDGLAINEFAINNSAFALNANGGWQQQDGKDSTQMAGKVMIKDLAAGLQALGFPSVISSKGGQANFALNWQDKPYQLDILSLQGDIDLSLGRGQIKGMDAQATAKIGLGNLINILSIESLARKLTLDFQDITDKDFAYSKMHGNFTLKQGNAYTDNAFLDGHIAYVGFKGRIGLVKKDYDLALKLVPYVTSSIPVLATIAGGPIIGAASFVAERLLKHRVDKSSTYNYHVTGTWKQPRIEKSNTVKKSP